MKTEIERIKRVFEEVLEDKKDNMAKLRLDMYFRLTKEKEWKKKLKEYQEKRKRLVQELNMQRIVTGKSIKSKEKALNLEKEISSANQMISDLEKALMESLLISETFIEGEKFINFIKKCVKTPKIVYERTEKYIRSNNRTSKKS